VYIKVGPSLHISLEEETDCKSFKMLVYAQDRQAIAGALADIGITLDGDHSWVTPQWVAKQSRLADDLEWQKAFAGMLAYAKSKGWTNEFPGAVRAHIEWM
jgi:hypothetical protein